MTDHYLSRKTSLYFMISLFFIWAFLVSMNDILIPYVKELFDFGYTEAILVQFSFFGTFFLMSLPAAALLERIGYTKGIVMGLLVMASGAGLFIPAGQWISYPLFLFALFVLASGVTLLQVAANPYVAALGSPETAASRLNLAQGFNSIAKTIAPQFGALLILNNLETLDKTAQAQAIQLPYLILSISLLTLAVIFFFLKLPTLTQLLQQNDKRSVERNIALSERRDRTSIKDYPYLLLGALGIFFYVGAEVCLSSFMTNFLEMTHITNLETQQAGRYLSLYWGGLMLGRFAGVWIMSKVAPQLMLSVMSFLGILLIFIGMTSEGWWAGGAIIATGLCLSIMFSNIFTLAIDGLGVHTSKGSGLLIMSIVGGAILPLIQGFFADRIGLQWSYFIPALAFAYILFYGMIGYRIGKAS